jgi:CheY-like chemotaxis protein
MIAGGHRGRKVLVIDDNPLNLKLVALVLTSEGFDVCTAADAASALEAVREHRPALVYADVQLPDMDGLELARAIKSNADTADTIVVALTALAMAEDRSRALAAGCDGFISKPIDTRRLASTTESFLSACEPPESQA